MQRLLDMFGCSVFVKNGFSPFECFMCILNVPTPLSNYFPTFFIVASLSPFFAKARIIASSPGEGVPLSLYS